jgi:DNA polymerase III delta subunit
MFAEVKADVTEVTGGLARIVKVGDRKQALQAIRDRMAEMLEGEEDPRDAAALSRELRALMGELASLDSAPKEQPRTGLDELERRRAARQEATG